jgi:hypothetical protein
MPAILIRILTWLMTSMAGQVMFSLGVGMVSFTAINTIMAFITERLKSYFLGTSQTMIVWIHLFELDYCVSVLLSAFIIRSTIMAAQVALARK